ncbi:hypothetical protein JXA85_05225 [Candidatus Woesearchaeota archaeon]|nr:hypothetical protein [Candidatus Woesearchaeota archaeon]
MLQSLIITHRGLEDVSETEAKEILGKNFLNSRKGESIVVCSLNEKQDFMRLIYMGQSFSRVLYFLTEFDFKDDFFEKLEKSINNIDFSEWVKERTFRVSCEREGNHDFSSEEVARKAGELILEKYGAKVNLSEPDVTVYAYIYNGHCCIGIDLAGIELSKRSYNVFSIPSSLKPSVAFGIFRASGFKKGTLIDSFCGNGMILIEAAMKLNSRSPHFFDKDRFRMNHGFFGEINMEEFFEKEDRKAKDKKLELYGYDNSMNHVQYSLKNAKIAGINKSLNFSRVEAEWLDTKFARESVDFIVTRIPDVSKRLPEKEALKCYKELFYNAEYILKKNGKMVLVMRKPERLFRFAAEYTFKAAGKRDVWQGNDLLKMVVFVKSKKEKLKY